MQTRQQVTGWKRVLAAVAAVVGLAGGAVVLTGEFVSAGNNTPTRRVIEVDVAEDPSRFIFDGDHVLGSSYGDLEGFPAYGDGFITQGWIYPEGTLTGPDDSGLASCEYDEDGIPISCEPKYEPIGVWTCYGEHVGEGAATTEGYMVITTQIFDFTEDGTQTIVTSGFERLNPGDVTERAVTGGTGRWALARGEQRQTSYGLHPEFFNVRSTSKINTLWGIR